MFCKGGRLALAELLSPLPNGDHDARQKEDGSKGEEHPFRLAWIRRRDVTGAAVLGKLLRVWRVGRGKVKGGGKQRGPDKPATPFAEPCEPVSRYGGQRPEVPADRDVAVDELLHHDA